MFVVHSADRAKNASHPLVSGFVAVAGNVTNFTAVVASTQSARFPLSGELSTSATSAAVEFSCASTGCATLSRLEQRER